MYYLLYGLIRFLSVIPLPVLYVFSDFVYFITYYIAGYRKKVVLKNLAIAFPDKTEKERRRIAKDFYHNLVDTFIETLKFFSWDIQHVNKRFKCDISELEKYFDSPRPIHVLAMHNFNWEFANWWFANRSKVPFYAIYMPLANRHLERMFVKMRTRYGTRLLPATDFVNRYAAVRNSPHILGSVADQSPANPHNAWWIDFFGRKTAFVRGAERGAKAAGATVFFLHFFKTRRGHFELDVFLYTENASNLPDGEMMKAYAQFVEKSIRARPANYLWSHRRWKLQWKEDYRENTI